MSSQNKAWPVIKETLPFALPVIVLLVAFSILAKNELTAAPEGSSAVIMAFPLLALIAISFLGSRRLLPRNVYFMAFLFYSTALSLIYSFHLGETIQNIGDGLLRLFVFLICTIIVGAVGNCARNIRDSRYKKRPEGAPVDSKICENCRDSKSNCETYPFSYGLQDANTTRSGNYITTKVTFLLKGSGSAIICEDCATKTKRKVLAASLIVLFSGLMVLLIHGILLVGKIVTYNSLLVSIFGGGLGLMYLVLAAAGGNLKKEQLGSQLAIDIKSSGIRDKGGDSYKYIFKTAEGLKGFELVPPSGR